MRTARLALAILATIGCLIISVSENKAEWQDIKPNQAVEYGVTKVDQGWTDKERDQFYSISGGSLLLPCSWFLALEQKDNHDLLVADHNIKQLHLVPTPWVGKMSKESKEASGCYSERLPIGIAITEIKDPQFHQLLALDSKWIGMNCAFCHTGIMHYTKEGPDKRMSRTSINKVHYTLYVDGGASMQYNYRFLTQLLGALRTTLADGDKFMRFARRVHDICKKESRVAKRCGNDAQSQDDLRRQVERYTHKLLSRSSIDILEWGFGRIDALGRGGNLVFSNLDPDNLRNANAPVSIPPLWYAWRYNAVQWSGLIRHPIARNISQTIAVGAGLFECDKQESECIKKLSDPRKAFSSTTDVRNILKLEDLIHTLKPPDWPEAVLGNIDPVRAMKGKQIYADKCARCHLPFPNISPTPTQKARGQLLSVKIVPREIPGKRCSDKRCEEIGTDPTYLINAGSRLVTTVSTIGDFSQLFGGRSVLPMADAIKFVTDEILKQAKDAGVLKPDDVSDNIWEPPSASKEGPPIVGYMARPHSAVWSTPPFLHNGSVPTLYDLLTPSFLPEHKMTPPAEWADQKSSSGKTWLETWREERGLDFPIRPKCFLVGDLEFDPIKVGYKVHQCDIRSRPDNPYSGFNFLAARPGNSNEGHEFSNYDRQTLEEFSEADCNDLAQQSRNGILGCGLSHDERLAIIEYLKTCDLDDLFEWKPGATPKKWDLHTPPRTSCRRPITLAKG